MARRAKAPIPTRVLVVTGNNEHYPDPTMVRWVCLCGNRRFEVYTVDERYLTFVKCPACGVEADVHVG